MDTEDEGTGYLKLFNEGSHNYLLHSSEDGLNDTFPVEPIFTEITSDWPSEGFPIYFSGSLVKDENNVGDRRNTNVQFQSEESENNVQNDSDEDAKPLTFFSNSETNSLVVSNDVLFKLDSDECVDPENTVTHVINGDTYSITYEQEDVENEENIEVIQLLDVDGSVTTINKNLFRIVNDKEKNITNLDNFYTEVQAHKCKLCSFLTESFEDMMAHIKIKHEKEIQQNHMNGLNDHVNSSDMVATKMTSILNVNQNKKYTLYLCSNCGSGYSNKEDLKQHMISQHKMVQISVTNTSPSNKTIIEKSKQTDTDKKRLARSDSANLLRKQKAMRNVKCSIKGCPLRFDKDESRKRHEDCHVDENKKQFMCPICKGKFSIWRICSMHMWKCHSIDLGLLTCPICNQFKSYSAVRVMNHMAIHNDEKPFICTSCGKSFKQLNQLRNHEISHKAPEDIPNSFAKKLCEFCDRYFANSKCLKKHIKFVHDKFKPFICNICGHQTARKEMLQLHYRQHTGDKPFHCLYCEYKTADRNCLRKHTMRHFGAAKYSCPYCNYQSIQTSAYKVHLASKHPGKEGTYSCNFCKYTTVNCNSYLSHIKYHEIELKKKVNGKIEKRTNVEDNESKSSDETSNFLNTEHPEEVVDTGGITIPAGFDLQLSTDSNLI